jgi:hypothetical protein
LIPDSCYLEMQQFLTRFPTAGVLIRGSNGCRKLRWKAPGQGKRGGIRLIYYWVNNEYQILMLTAYAKSTIDDLSAGQIKKLGQLVAKELKER